MRQVTVPEAEAMFGALVSEVEHGETIEIVEDGRVVARLVAPLPMLKKPLDIEGLRAHLATMPMQDESAGDFVSKMGDAARAFGTQVASILSGSESYPAAYLRSTSIST